LKKQLFQ